MYIEPKPEEDLEVTFGYARLFPATKSLFAAQEKAAREALMEKFRVEQEEREYADMVHSVVTSENDKFVLGIRPDELRETKSHLAAIVNIMVSMGAVALAVYMAAKTMTEDVGMVSVRATLHGSIRPPDQLQKFICIASILVTHRCIPDRHSRVCALHQLCTEIPDAIRKP